MADVTVPLFDRRCSVQVDSLKVEGLRITFDVEKDTRRESNNATIRIFNLAEVTRKKLQQDDIGGVLLLAGYKDQIETIFVGDIDKVLSSREGTEWITEFSVADGRKAGRKRGGFSKKGTNTKQQIKDLVDYIGKGPGNFDEVIGKLAAQGQLPPGDVTKQVQTGNVADNIEKLSKDLGINFSFQDGKPHFTKVGSILDSDVVVLSAATGLVGSPEITKKGYLHARCVIQQKLTPGKGVIIDSLSVKGLYQIHKVKYDGDTHGDNWFATLDLMAVT